MKEYVTGSKKLNQYPRQARQTAWVWKLVHDIHQLNYHRTYSVIHEVVQEMLMIYGYISLAKTVT
jgi:hypothetical protein